MRFLYDFFPILLFFIAYKIYGIYAATAVAIAASFIQVAGFWLKHRRFETMHLITLGLITVLGGATIWLHDEAFIKWKVSVVNWLFGLVFLGSQFIGKRCLAERMMGSAITLPAPIWLRLNVAWSIFFITMGMINVYVIYNYDTDTWVNFKLFGMMGMTFTFVIAQGFYLARFLEPDGSVTVVDQKPDTETTIDIATEKE